MLGPFEPLCAAPKMVPTVITGGVGGGGTNSSVTGQVPSNPTQSIETPESTIVSLKSPSVNFIVAVFPLIADGITKEEQISAVSSLKGVVELLNPEEEGVRVTPALMEGGGGALDPPAGEPFVSADPIVKDTTLPPEAVLNLAKKKSSNLNAGVVSLVKNW